MTKNSQRSLLFLLPLALLLLFSITAVAKTETDCADGAWQPVLENFQLIKGTPYSRVPDKGYYRFHDKTAREAALEYSVGEVAGIRVCAYSMQAKFASAAGSEVLRGYGRLNVGTKAMRLRLMAGEQAQTVFALQSGIPYRLQLDESGFEYELVPDMLLADAPDDAGYLGLNILASEDGRRFHPLKTELSVSCLGAYPFCYKEEYTAELPTGTQRVRLVVAHAPALIGSGGNFLPNKMEEPLRISRVSFIYQEPPPPPSPSPSPTPTPIPSPTPSPSPSPAPSPTPPPPTPGPEPEIPPGGNGSILKPTVPKGKQEGGKAKSKSADDAGGKAVEAQPRAPARPAPATAGTTPKTPKPEGPSPQPVRRTITVGSSAPRAPGDITPAAHREEAPPPPNIQVTVGGAGGEGDVLTAFLCGCYVTAIAAVVLHCLRAGKRKK